MSAWRRKSIELVPAFKAKVEKSDSPADLWIELYSEFEIAVEEKREEVKRGILQYLRWSFSEVAGTESQQAVSCGFLEDIAGNENNWSSFRSWFSSTEFEKYKASFKYALNEKRYNRLEDIFYGR